MATIGSLKVVIGADIGPLEKGLQTAAGRMKTFGQNLRSVGTGLTLGLSAPIAGIATQALKSAANFEQSMAMMQVATGATGNEMDQLQKKALDLGAKTAFSAGEAAEAMLELGKAGMDAGQVSGAIAGVLDLAAAGGLDLADAASIAANTLNAFNLPAEKAAEVANLLAAGANASTADVSDLAQGMQMASAVFSASGQTVQDLTTALALMSNNAIAGSDAGTSLKTMLMRLAAPTGEAAQVLRDLGIRIYNTDGSMRGFREIVVDLEKSTKGLTDAQRNAALTTVFGADAIRAANVLVSEGVAGWDAMYEAVNQQGAAAQMAGARMSGLGGAVEYFKGSVDSFLIGSAMPFTDSLAGMVRGAADFISKIGELPASVQQVGAVGLAILAVLGPALVILGSIVTAAAGLASPLGLVVLGFVAAGVAATLFAANVGGVKDTVLGYFNEIVEAADTIESAFVIDGPFSDAGIAAIEMLPGKLAGVGKAALGVAAAFKVIWEAMKGWSDVEGGMAALRTFNTIFGPEATTNLSAAASVIGKLAEGFKTLATTGDLGPLAQTFGELKTAGSYLADMAQGDTLGALREWQKIPDYLKPATEILGTLAGKLSGLRAIPGYLRDLAAGDTLGALREWQKIPGFIQPAVEALGLLASKLPGLKSAGTYIKDMAGGDVLGALRAWQDVPGYLQPATEALGNLAGKLGQLAGSKTISDLAARFGIKLDFDFQLDVGAVSQKLQQRVQVLNGLIQGALGQLLSGDNIVSRSVSRIQQAWGTIQTQLQGIDAVGPAEQFRRGVEIVTATFGVFGAIKWDILTTAADGLTKVATSILGFATSGIEKLNVETIAGALTGLANNYVAALKIVFAPENMADLGTAVGQLGVAISAKLSELFGSATFGTDIGKAVGNATGALLEGATALVGGVVGQISAVPIATFQDSIDTFVLNLVKGMITGLAGANWGDIGGAIVEAIKLAIMARLGNTTPLGMVPVIGPALNAPAKMIGVPTWAEIFEPALGAMTPVESGANAAATALNNLTPAAEAAATAQTNAAAQIAQTPISITDWQKNLGVPRLLPGQTTQASVIDVTANVTQIQTAPEMMGTPPAVDVVGKVTSIDSTALTAADTMLPMGGWQAPMSLPGAEALQTAASTLAGWTFTWPKFPEWTWPTLPVFTWPTLPSWTWPAIPAPGWLSRLQVPRPDWLGEMLSWSPVVTLRQAAGAAPAAGSNAVGTSNWRGGLTWVGETGPELAWIPAGSSIFNARESRELMDSEQPIRVEVNVANVASGLDLEVLAYKVAQKIDQHRRR